MTVNPKSWHARAYRFMGINKSPSVCVYWANVLLGFPIVCLIIGILWPFGVVLDKLGEIKDKRGTLCPFGKVEFK